MKKITLLLFVLMSCSKPELEDEIRPIVTTNTNIFEIKENTVSDGQDITFTLTKEGVYTITMKDSLLNQVITREKFSGKIGLNKLKIYTKSIQSKYLYLTLVDDGNNQIGKTIINLNK
jgi:hypothetical protein